MTTPLVVWRFHDGKPGHDRQSAGLLLALADLLPLTIYDLPASTIKRAGWRWLRGDLPELAALPSPSLIVGAGSRCQLALLAARRARGGHTVCLMKPALPACCFDLCLVPRHDGIAASAKVELTVGVLNDLTPGPQPRTGPSAILVGGPSRHHGWDEPAILRQIASIVFGSRERQFVLTDSRRTPAATSQALNQFAQKGVQFVPHASTSPAWIAQTLRHAPLAWVTADSVSMTFEALTAGCAVGLIEVPAKRADRITGIATQLVAEASVTPLVDWLRSGVLAPPPQRLAEANRCAAIIRQRFFPGRSLADRA